MLARKDIRLTQSIWTEFFTVLISRVSDEPKDVCWGNQIISSPYQSDFCFLWCLLRLKLCPGKMCIRMCFRLFPIQIYIQKIDYWYFPDIFRSLDDIWNSLDIWKYLGISEASLLRLLVCIYIFFKNTVFLCLARAWILSFEIGFIGLVTLCSSLTES